MRAIGVAVLMAIGGTFVAAMFTFVIGLAGAPGALLSAARREGASPYSLPGLVLTCAGQVLAAILFAAVVVLSTRSLLGDASGVGSWLAWLVAWWVSTAPALFALRDASRAEVKNVQHVASTFTMPLTAIGFWILVAVPQALAALAWVPHL